MEELSTKKTKTEFSTKIYWGTGFAASDVFHILLTQSINDTHMEELVLVQKFIEIQVWLLLTFFICLHDQLSSFNSIIVQMSEKCDSSNRQ